MKRALTVAALSVLAMALLSPVAQGKQKQRQFQDLTVVGSLPAQIFFTVVFLDKHGNVSMIPHDGRVTGQTKEEFDATLTQETAVPGEDTQHQRGSKEAEYGRKRIGQVQLPLDIQDSIRAVLDGAYRDSPYRTVWNCCLENSWSHL